MIAIACDHGGYNLKEAVKAHLMEKGYEVKDFGTNSLDSCDYPDYAAPAAKAVADGNLREGHCHLHPRHRRFPSLPIR